MQAKLSSEDKVEIALSEKSLRDLGAQYSVHHSTIETIKREAKEVLRETFTSKKAGRPPTERNITAEEYDKLNEKYLQVRDQAAITSMEKDFLAIEHKYYKIRAEAGQQELSEEDREMIKKKRRQLRNKKKRKKKS